MIKPLDYLDFANELVSSKTNTEVKNRTSIGRSYYAVYLFAFEKYIESKKGSIKEGDIRGHAKFIYKLKEERIGPFKKVGNQLADLKQDRENADYKVNYNITVNSAKKSYSAALRIKENVLLFSGNK